MGAGKTTVGRVLAERLGVPFVDSDTYIEAEGGRSIPEIFATDGEAGFRAIEAESVSRALRSSEGVIALGGGSPTIPEVRDELRRHHVLWLDVSLGTALARAGSPEERPMLRSADVPGLFSERRGIYGSVASVVLDAERDPQRIVDEAIAALAERVKVDIGARSYDVVTAEGSSARVGAEVARLIAPEKAFIVTHPSLAGIAEGVVRSCEAEGIETRVAEVPEGESSKSIRQAESLLEQMALAEMHRNDVVIGVGGGVITDLAGFVASVFARGIAVVHIPTTLLAQVDAAVGGKTGIDLPQGKNLVGTFHQPRLVFCDPSHLETLEESEFVSGLAEVAKAGLIADPDLVAVLGGRRGDVLARMADVMTDIVRNAVRIKASVVGEDERESGLRAILNYGHTFAHAIETWMGFGKIRHGEAVSLGMVAAARLSELVGLARPGLVERHTELLSGLGLPVSATLRYEDLEPFWKLDKKYSGGVRFVLLRDIGDPVIGVSVQRAQLEEALERMSG